MTGLAEIARALGGIVAGHQVLAPGPGHGPRDRSLSVRLSPEAPGGFIVHAHSPRDNWRACRDYVADRLGLDGGPRRREPAHSSPPFHREKTSGAFADLERERRASRIWASAGDLRGTLGEVYLAGRALALDDATAGAVRFCPRTPWRDDSGQAVIFVPAMIAAMRDVRSDRLVAVQRTRLDERGRKVERRMLGRAAGAAIKLDPDETVTTRLVIGEGCETGLAARVMGLRPTWALGSAGAIRTFPVLSGIEVLVILCEADDGGTNEAAARECGARWYAAGREVILARPRGGDDMAAVHKALADG